VRGTLETPLTNTPRVYVNEIGMRIVAHAAAMERKGDLAQALGFHAGDSQIDRLRLHVEAVLGDTFTVGTKKLVAPGCAVPANDVNFSVGTPHSRRQILQDVKDLGIEMMNLARAMVSEKIVELRDGVSNVLIPSAVHDIEPLARVRVI